ncbi:beta subunit of N-acylethanolamine-hydrolyzing acid amidase-domain-containing protein [Aspergillus pseudoustus]|uniref:ceramidase n=1 Tax=Aspergillus pseudoustus TaxID=1810923 RepID=A0ABR4J9H0_9EURO
MPSSSAPGTPSTIGTSSVESTSTGDTPPTHRIDLSLAPRARYASLVAEYAPRLRSITSIFDTLVLDIFPESYLRWIKALARVFLRRVYDDEETEEIRGIAETTGIEVYLVVCLNVLLDLLMGCTSGAALYKPGHGDGDGLLGGGEEGDARMLHFRTLDWDMPALRQLLVTLEFVESDEPSAPVVARSVTYVGFVGILTGVRPGLSVSLNFRPNHDDTSWVKNFKYYGRHLLVLLGCKRSIPSMLRQTIVPSRPGKPSWFSYLFSYLLIWKRYRTQQPMNTLPLKSTVSHILSTPSTACYLILSDGRESYVLEKDYKTTTVESSTSFIVATNNDRDVATPQATEHSSRQEHTGASLTVAGDPVLLVDFIKDSIERRACMQANWDIKVTRARQAARRASQASSISFGSSSQARSDPLRRTRSSRREGQTTDNNQTQDSAPATTTATASIASAAQPEVTASLEELVTWTSRYPTTNEMTHFATILDPMRGTVAWIKRYLEPLECSWELTDFE